MRLTLWFHTRQQVQLYRVQFERPDGAKLVAVRGKAAHSPGLGSFQWTEAVKAFALLAVGSLRRVRARAEPFALEGVSPSPAASLDFAISKNPRWLGEIFGDDAEGRPYSLRVFRRINPEQRGGGPVTVSLCSALLDEAALRVFVLPEPDRSPPTLDTLFRDLAIQAGLPLEREELSTNSGTTLLVSPASDDDTGRDSPVPTPQTEKSVADRPAWYRSNWFRSQLEYDVHRCLQETFLLEPLGIQATMNRVRAEGAVEAGRLEAVLESLKETVPDETERYGLVGRRYGDTVPPALNLEVACPLMSPATVVLLRSLQDDSRGTVNVSFAFSSTSAIVSHASLFDAVVLSWSAAEKLLNSPSGSEFRPFALLPRTSYDFVVDPSWQHNTASDYGRVLVTHERSAYPWIYYQALCRDGVEPLSTLRPCNATPAEIATLIGREAAAAVVSFPFARLPAERYGLRHFNAYEERSRIGDNVLFVSARHLADDGFRRSLALLIREVWYRLLEDPVCRAAAVKSLLEDDIFFRFLMRVGGFHAFAEWDPGAGQG